MLYNKLRKLIKLDKYNDSKFETFLKYEHKL